MLITAWNLAHQTHERAINPEFIPAVRSLRPDILILNEYVHGDSRGSLVHALGDLGLNACEVSVRIANNNQVLIASRYPLELGELRGVPTESGGGESNFLHVIVPHFRLEVIGMRVPDYDGPALKQYWRGFEHLVSRVKDRRVIFAGDLNADPNIRGSVGGKGLARMREDGWYVPEPKGDWSFKSGSRIDHTIVSPTLPEPLAEYCTAREGITFCHRTGPAISDHAALNVTFESDSLAS